MGLFGSDSKTYTTSTTNLTQEDRSVATAGDAENILGSNAKQIQAQGSTVIDTPMSERDIIFNQFPVEVQDTVGDLIQNVETTTKTLGQALSQKQLGVASDLPKFAMIIVVGGGLIFLASRLIK